MESHLDHQAPSPPSAPSQPSGSTWHHLNPESVHPSHEGSGQPGGGSVFGNLFGGGGGGGGGKKKDDDDDKKEAA